MITLIGSEKGGTGKTTIATNLAVMRAHEGRDVLLVDGDPQGSATNWASVRGDRPPPITCVSKTGPKAGLDIARLRDKFDDIIVDAGGRDSVELRSVMVIADQLVIPVKPSQFDVWTLSTMEQLTLDAQARGNEHLAPIVCLNMVSTNPGLKHEAEEVADYLKDFPTLALFPHYLYERVPYRRGARQGGGVIEVSDSDTKKATSELQHLYDFLFSQ